jgi:predicted DNA-binding transcriptional regulator AlpA
MVGWTAEEVSTLMSRKIAAVLPAQTPAPRIESEPILTIEDIAVRLRFKNTSSVYELTRKRNRRPMPAMRAAKVLRFYWSEVERWLRGEDVA